MKRGLIYKAVNKFNQKCYIGLTTSSLNKRKIEHLSESLRKEDNYKFYNAIRKYGFDSFVWEIIEDNIPVELLCEREIYWITFYDTFEKGYNLTIGGEGTFDYKWTDEQKMNQSVIQKEVQNRSEIKVRRNKKISIALKGRAKTEEHKEKQRRIALLIQKEIQNRPEVKEKQRIASLGRKHTFATKKKMSENALSRKR